MKKIYKLEKSFCMPCILNIKYGLQDLKGVQKVIAYPPKHVIEVEFDEEQITLERIFDEIKDYGDYILKELQEIPV